jgi:hypothetical protein
LSSACSYSPEQDLLKKYFQAAKLRDTGTLSNIATVNFSPDQEGVVQNFTVVSSGEEQRRPLKLKELAAAEAAARSAEEDFNKQKRAYQDANLEGIERVLKAEAAGKSIARTDTAVQTAWSKWREDTKQFSEKLAEARRALSAERRLVEPSVNGPRNAVDPTQYEGELITKDLVIRANVKKGDAPAQERELNVRLTKADLKNGPDGKSVEGRWIITHISDAKEGQPPPTS